MTKTEQAELESLGMTPEQLEERKGKLAALLAETPTNEVAANFREAIRDGLAAAERKRKPRKDKGVPKPKKPAEAKPAPSGGITAQQRSDLEYYRTEMDRAESNAEFAQENAKKAALDYFDFLDSITVKD